MKKAIIAGVGALNGLGSELLTDLLKKILMLQLLEGQKKKF